jgi:N-carbamoylputrescine amidase
MAALAAELQVVLPVSFFERANNAYYNSVAMIDADGRVMGVYRKSHIPDGPGYQEKFYFVPGDTGFRAWQTRYAAIGTGICWDQWFPECARAMALMGAEILFYPTAIGNEPQDTTISAKDHWQRTMQGHAAANMVPLVASNRIGREAGEAASLTFYGASFIADQTGAKVAEADGETRTVLTASFDLDAIRAQRASWGLFRDRRPELYGPLLTADGKTA